MTNEEARTFLHNVADRIETIAEVNLTSRSDGNKFYISRAEILAMQTALSCAAAILQSGVSTDIETFTRAMFSTHADSVLELHSNQPTE